MKAEIIYATKKHRLNAGGGIKGIRQKVKEFIKGQEEKIIAIRIYEEIDIDYQINLDFSDKFKNWDI